MRGLLLIFADYSACFRIDQMHAAANQAGNSERFPVWLLTISPGLDIQAGCRAAVKERAHGIDVTPLPITELR